MGKLLFQMQNLGACKVISCECEIQKNTKVKVFSYNLVTEQTVYCCHISCSYSDKVVKTNLIVNSRCPYITIMVNKKVLLL